MQLKQRLQPFVHFDLQVGTALFAILVDPVRGNPFFCQVVHALRANLDFDRRAVGADQCGVQGLVAVFLGNGDVVLEFPRNRLVARMQRAYGQVASWNVFDKDAKAVDVEHLRKGKVLVDHFLIDRIEAFFPAKHTGFDVALLQLTADAVQNF